MPNRFKTVGERWAQRRLHPAMPISRMSLRSHWEIGLVYLAGYVLLDWISFIHPIASFGITPWNPPPALSFALILLFGPEFLPWLFAAPLLADALVRQFPLPMWAELVAALLIGFGYGAGALVLTAPRLRFDVRLASKRDLLCLVAVAAAASAVVALSYVLLVMGIGLLEPAQFGQAALRYWIGDMIGIAVVTPFILVFFTRRRTPALSWEFLAPLAVLVVALWLVIGVETLRFQLFERVEGMDKVDWVDRMDGWGSSKRPCSTQSLYDHLRQTTSARRCSCRRHRSWRSCRRGRPPSNWRRRSC